MNCKRSLDGEHFCPNCGQENTDRNISFWILTKDFLGDYFSFDTKLFRTMFPLIIYPGTVPREFIEGKRVKYIPPLRILIFSSFIFFFIWGITYDPDIEEPKNIAQQADAHLEEGIDLQEEIVDSTIVIGIDGANLNLTGFSMDELNSLIKLHELRKLLDQGMRIDNAVDSIAVYNTPLEQKIYTQFGKIYRADDAALTKYFVSNLSIIILIMQPFFALLLKLLYIRRRKEYRFIQHLVFSLYYHGWLLIMSTFAILLTIVFKDLEPEMVVSLLALIYMPLALKNFYDQSWSKTAMKSFIIIMMYIGLIVPFFLIISMMISFYFF